VAIVGTGVDIVEVDRLDGVIARRGERFVGRVFTPTEREYCDARPRPVIHYAGRFAVKEAVLKAIRTGWVEGISWTDVEVELGPKGEPSVKLTGGARQEADEQGIGSIHISISHSEHYAVAMAVAES